MDKLFEILTPHKMFEVGAFVVSLICFNRLKNTTLFWFIPFLFFIVLVEFTGYYIRNVLHLPNAPFYNFTIPLEHLFYAFIFYRHFKTPVLKKIAFGFLFFIPLFALINIFFIQGLNTLNNNILLVGSCSMTVISCLYFVDIFRREEVILLKEPMFWITFGVLVFNMGEFPYILFLDYLKKNQQDPGAILFISIMSILIYVLYTFISIGLLCMNRPYRKI